MLYVLLLKISSHVRGPLQKKVIWPIIDEELAYEDSIHFLNQERNGGESVRHHHTSSGSITQADAVCILNTDDFTNNPSIG